MIGYNPYNWKIVKDNNVKPFTQCNPSDFACILDELSRICNELDLLEIEEDKLRVDLINAEKKKLSLRQRKDYLLKLMSEP